MSKKKKITPAKRQANALRAKRSRAAKKGWVTRLFNKRSEAAKKGWRKRRRKLYDHLDFVTGYNSEGFNSYCLRVEIQRKREETLQHVSDRIEKLAAEGYFDELAREIANVNDLRWASFHNEWRLLSRKGQKKRIAAVLTDFVRISPGEYEDFESGL